MYGKKEDIPALEQSVRDIEKFEKDLQEAVKDKKDAQIMYGRITQSAEALGRTLPDSAYGGAKQVYPNYMMESAKMIKDIIREESVHERKFTANLVGMQTIKQRLKEEIQKCKRDAEEEQRKLAEQQRKEQEAQKDRLNHARITEIRRRGSGYG